MSSIKPDDVADKHAVPNENTAKQAHGNVFAFDMWPRLIWETYKYRQNITSYTAHTIVS